MRATLLLLLALCAACQDTADDTAPPPDQGRAWIEDAAPLDAAPLDAAPLDAAPLDAAPDALPDATPPFIGLRITPAQARLAIADAPPTHALTLERVAEDGEITQLPPQDAAWRVSPAFLGSVEPQTGVFTASNELGVAEIEAALDGEIARAQVEIIGAADVIDEGAPADAPTRFEGAPLAGPGCAAPTLLYPQAGTVFPRVLNGLTFQWRAYDFDLYMLSLRAGPANVRYFTQRDQLTPALGTWAVLQREAARGVPLEVTLMGLDRRTGQICMGAPALYRVDDSRLKGAIYYWSTGRQGIMRLAVDGTEPEPFLLTSPQINCPACHALSRDGQRVAFTRTTFPPFGEMAVSDTVTPSNLRYDPAGIAGYFPSWAPDSARLVASAGGELFIFNADTGQRLNQLPNPPGRLAGSPDWSWQGERIVAAAGPSEVNLLPDVGITGGGIYMWRYLEHQWLAPTSLVEPPEARWLDRPAFSPDGRWVIYNSLGSAGGDRDASNPDIDLWLIESRGEGEPIRLNHANQGDLMGNSWPKWAPYDGRGTLWVAFSSLRDYGHLLVNSGAEYKTPQIWISAIDPEAAARGVDPSAPAFRLPYQAIDSGNHIPYWAIYEKD
ncbi:hypothetical protein KKF91_02545 [Myxococcota bacterium]|nr:hypothetical protein [Myxococcota bacterium]MBU1429419.1 hypothetical protein [Myxococcota bacterium]MBU1899395.1 hypothetical protein [Myxococcota bacterium]